MCKLVGDVFKKYKISNICFKVKDKNNVISNICFRDNTYLNIPLKDEDCQYKDLQNDLNILFSNWGNI